MPVQFGPGACKNMKILRNIIIIVVILLIVAYLSIFIFVSTNGKALVSENLKNILGRDVYVGSVYLTPPFSININNLEIKDLAKLNSIKVEPSILGLFFGRTVLNKLTIVNPAVSIVRLTDSQFNFSPVVGHMKRSQGKKVEFIVKEAFIRQGRINFKDKTQDISFDISPINISVVTSLIDRKTRINLDAQAISADGQNLANISASGWLNFFKKDMDAELSIKDVELIYFTAYFKDFLRKVKSGKLFFDANMVSKNNDLLIDCHLETHNLRFIEQESQATDTQQKVVDLFDNLSSVILGALIGPGGGGIFDFSIHTKFDNPKLEGLQFKGNIFKEPIRKMIEEPEETIEKFKKVGEEFEKVGKELKEQFKGIEDIFKGLGKEEADSGEPQPPSQ